jgi:hypothetical protein
MTIEREVGIQEGMRRQREADARKTESACLNQTATLPSRERSRRLSCQQCPFRSVDDHVGSKALLVNSSDLIPSGTLDRKLRIGNDDGGEYELTFRITRHQGTVFAQNAYFAMATRHSKHMEVWGVDLTGTVRGNWFDGRCQGWYRLAGARFSQGTFLAAVSPAWEAAERGPADSAARGACAAVVTAAMTPLSLLKSSFSLTPLMLSSIEHTLLPDDIGSRVALPDASKYRDHAPHFSSRCSRYGTSSRYWSGRVAVGRGFPVLTGCSGCGSPMLGPIGEPPW